MTSVGPLTRVDFARFAAATNDYNPIHLDENYATRSGLPSVVGSGLLAAAVIAETSELGTTSGLLSVRFKRPILPATMLSCDRDPDGTYHVRDANGSDIAVGRVDPLPEPTE